MDARIVAALVGALVGTLGTLAVQWLFAERRHREELRSRVLSELLRDAYGPLATELYMLVFADGGEREVEAHQRVAVLISKWGHFLPRQLTSDLMRYNANPSAVDIGTIAARFDEAAAEVRRLYWRTTHLTDMDLD